MISTIIIVVAIIAVAVYLRQGIINKNAELKAAFDKLDAEIKAKAGEKVTEVKEKVSKAKAKKAAKAEEKTEEK